MIFIIFVSASSMSFAYNCPRYAFFGWKRRHNATIRKVFEYEEYFCKILLSLKSVANVPAKFRNLD